MANHLVMSQTKGESFLASNPAPEFDTTDFPNGWSGAGLADAGMFMFILHASPNAEEFTIHASEDTWLAYVVSGSGTLYAGTDKNEKTTGLVYQAGDFISFAANTPHGWLNDKVECKLLFVKQA